MKKISLLVLSLCCMLGMSAQTTNLAYFPFTNNVAAPSTPTSYTAEAGTQATTAGLYLDGTHGSSAWLQASELTANSGSTINATTGTGAGKDLAMINSSANGKSFVFHFATTGYQNIVLTMAARRTSTGFNASAWEYSTDGTTFTALTGLSTMPSAASTYELATLDLTSITAVNEQANVYLRCTLTGASSDNGSYRIDNVQINAVPAGPDVYAPIVSSVAVDNATTVLVSFNEAVSNATATSAANYVIDGTAASQATLNANVVTVTVPTMVEGTAHQMIIRNVADVAGNVMTPDTANFTFGIAQQYHVQNIAALRAKWTAALNTAASTYGDTIYKLSGHVIVTALNASYRNQIFIQDSTGAIVVDDANGLITRALEMGDEITDIYGKLTDYYGQLQFSVTQNCSAPISIYNEVAPLTVTLTQLQDVNYMNLHQSELIRMDNVTFTQTGTFANNTKYTISQDGNSAEVVWIHIWNIATLTGAAIPTVATNLTGVNKINYSKYYIIPRSGTDLGTGIAQYLTAKDVTVYPNPVNDILHVSLNNNLYQVNTLQVFDVSGKLILTQNIHDAMINLNVNNLQSGNYFLRLSNGRQSYTTRFIKK